MGKIGGLRPGVMQNLEFAVFVGAKRAVIEKRGSADGGERSGSLEFGGSPHPSASLTPSPQGEGYKRSRRLAHTLAIFWHFILFGVHFNVISY